MAEMGCVVAGEFQLRRYALYVCATQEQADDHVGNIARLFEQLGVDRQVGKYGSSMGWRRNRVWTQSGFIGDGFGLDAARRGAKIQEARPDLFVLDDIDREHDTALTTEKKIKTITQALLPSGAPDAAVVGVQNLVHGNSIFAQLADGRADFLSRRQVIGPYPALQDFHYDMTEQGVVIRHGTPSWSGLGIEECRQLIHLIGIRAFNIESQHQIELVSGTFFRREWFQVAEDWPRRHIRVVRFWDLAATEKKPGTDPDWTCGTLMVEQEGRYWIVDVQRIRGRPYEVEALMRHTATADGHDVDIVIEQEPGSSGIIALDHYQRYVLQGYSVVGRPATGAKVVRWKPLSSAVEAGNVCMVTGAWNTPFLTEAVLAPSGGHDDHIDSASGAFAELAQQGVARGMNRVRISGF